jgi:hypothetical protein
MTFACGYAFLNSPAQTEDREHIDKWNSLTQEQIMFSIRRHDISAKVSDKLSRTRTAFFSLDGAHLLKGSLRIFC